MHPSRGPLTAGRTASVAYVRPGMHSHNRRRQTSGGTTYPAGSAAKRSSLGLLRLMQRLLLVIGLCAVGYYGYTLANQYIYQSYENWAFDQEIAGRRDVHFSDYVRERTPFGFLAGTKSSPATTALAPQEPPEWARPVHGSVLGRVEIPRLNLAAMVREGVDAKTLSLAVGHVPSTSLPGQAGNFAIAAHRDTLFRVLKDIRLGDLVTFESPAGMYTYRVVATKIVTPSDVSVLRPDGGGLIPARLTTAGGQPEKLLTMITCYPFYYVGSAPKRFIVEAQFVSRDPSSKFAVVARKQAAGTRFQRG